MQCLVLAATFGVHPADPVGGDLLGADGFTFEVAAAAAEALRLHLACLLYTSDAADD